MHTSTRCGVVRRPLGEEFALPTRSPTTCERGVGEIRDGCRLPRRMRRDDVSLIVAGSIGDENAIFVLGIDHVRFQVRINEPSQLLAHGTGSVDVAVEGNGCWDRTFRDDDVALHESAART